MSTKLEQILEQTRLGVTARMGAADHASLDRQAAAHRPRGFAANLGEAAKNRPAVIAELKKASPSKGLIRSDFQAAELAVSLEQAGAAALSVLTNKEFFQGSLENLEAASQAVRIPCLRKDFMVDPFQVMEARAYGADAILLIVAAHTDATLKLLRESARQYGLDVLCEVHGREELARAIDLGCDAIGVNSRNLHDFTVHPDTLLELAAFIPKDVVRVAESGISSSDEMLRLRAAGYDAFLIGEALMRQTDPGRTLAEMLGQFTATGA